MPAREGFPHYKSSNKKMERNLEGDAFHWSVVVSVSVYLFVSGRAIGRDWAVW
jgi:hypothetical protein